MSFARSISNTLAAAAIGILASGGLLRAQELKEITIALDWIPNVEFAGLWIAMEKGYFAEEGLKVEFLPGGPNATPAAVSVAAGKADFGYTSWLPFADAILRKNDFKLVAATFPESPQCVISLAKKPILAAKDLVGSSILVPAPNAKIAIEATLKLNDLPSEWKEVPSGFSPEPLLAGQADGFVGFATNQVITLEKLGLELDKDFHFTSFYDMGFPQFGSGIFVPTQTLQEHSDTVRGFLKALARGWALNAQDPSIGADLAVGKFGRDLGLNAAQQLRQNEIQISRMPENPREMLVLDREIISGPMYAAAEVTGREGLPDPAKIIDFDLMAEIQSELRNN